MLTFLAGKVSDRKLRLFAAACARLNWDLLVDDRSRVAVEVAERVADGTAADEEREVAFQAAWAACRSVAGPEQGPQGQGPAWRAAVEAIGAARKLHQAAVKTYPGAPHWYPGSKCEHAAKAADTVRVRVEPFPRLKVAVGAALKATRAAHLLTEKSMEEFRSGSLGEAYLTPHEMNIVERPLPAWEDAERAWDQALRGVNKLSDSTTAAMQAAAGCCAATGFIDHCTSQAKGRAKLLRCVVGNPFWQAGLTPCPPTTGVIQVLARSAYEDRCLPQGVLCPLTLAALADALEESGFRDAGTLTHLRSPGPHVRGCWPVDLILARGRITDQGTPADRSRDSGFP
jgi:hypothetical protein